MEKPRQQSPQETSSINLVSQLKELRETQRWLKLIQRVPLINEPALLNDILQETEELIRIFFKSIKTVEKKMR